MVTDPNEVLEFDFEGVEPATFSGRVAMPKGEYNLQCTAIRKYFKGDKGGTVPGQQDKPGLEFTFAVNNHPDYTGQEFKIWHPLSQEAKPFLLNTLTCLIPEFNWQANGIRVPLSQLIEKGRGRPCNGYIEWEINVSEKDDRKYVNNRLQNVKPFDQSITQPMPTEGNPPTVVNESASQITKQAASGVSKEEVNQFLGQWDQSTGTPAPAPSESNFFNDPF